MFGTVLNKLVAIATFTVLSSLTFAQGNATEVEVRPKQPAQTQPRERTADVRSLSHSKDDAKEVYFLTQYFFSNCPEGIDDTKQAKANRSYLMNALDELGGESLQSHVKTTYNEAEYGYAWLGVSKKNEYEDLPKQDADYCCPVRYVLTGDSSDKTIDQDGYGGRNNRNVKQLTLTLTATGSCKKLIGKERAIAVNPQPITFTIETSASSSSEYVDRPFYRVINFGRGNSSFSHEVQNNVSLLRIIEVMEKEMANRIAALLIQKLR